MSTLISKLPIATSILSSQDIVVVNQGVPGITRIGTVLMLLAAFRTLGSVQMTAPAVQDVPKKISQLDMTDEIYWDNLVAVDQGNPAVTRLVTVQMIQNALSGTPSNTEYKDGNQDMNIGNLPLATQANLTDWMLINQGNPPVTRRIQLANL